MTIIQNRGWPVNLLYGVVDAALAIHLAGAGAWWWLSPKGFPIDRCQFWINSVLPVVAMGLAVLGLIAMHYRRRSIAAATVLCFTSAWAAAAIAARYYFPISLAGFWIALLLVAVIGAFQFALLAHDLHRRLPVWLPAAAFGAAVGIAVARCQVPRPASTMPINEPPPDVEAMSDSATASVMPIGNGASFHAESASLSFTTDGVEVRCSPLLFFHRVSPDGFWSLLAPRRSGTRRQCTQQVARPESIALLYSDGATFEISNEAGGTMELTAFTPLAVDTYSHLNSYCELEIGGHKELALSFSPCPTALVTVEPADYPFGRPARMAYIAASNEFRVVEATSGEKGPFRLLASGPCHRGDMVTISIHDGARTIGSIVLHDWTAQTSTDLSPTAGWGFPVNAIEFQREDDDPSSPATIWITLAATSVGRGFDVVGHRAGVYRNRMTINRGR